MIVLVKHKHKQTHGAFASSRK